MTLILGIETSSSESGVALSRDGSPLAEVEFRHQMSLLTQLPSRIEEVVSSRGVAMSDLTGVGVSAGPGSFTGLRIALATAKAIAYSLRIPIVGLSTLEIIARNVAPEGRLICPMVAWRGEKVFCAAYTGSTDGSLSPVLCPAARDLSALLADVAQPGSLTGVVFVGDGAQRHRESIVPGFGGESLADPELGRPRARVTAQMAKEALAKNPEGDDISQLAPKYLQKTYVGTD